ncbi:MAG: hypothetical protein KGL66_04875, partial [Alphaproteobacteria bacterium]|nr:hypothetical protein [Alphaproteobacteria bacterium]
GAIVARLTAGANALEPGLELLADDHLSADMRMRLAERLRAWLTAYIATRLEPLLALKKAADAKPGAPGALPAEARGLAFQLCEALGALDRRQATMPDDERAAGRGLRGFGVRFARRSIFLPKLLRPQAASLLALLWGVYRRLEKLPPPPAPGLTSFERDDALLEGFLAAAGFRLAGPRAIRLDMLDRLEEELEAAAAKGLSAATALPRLVSLLGTDAATLQAVLAALGWQQVEVAGPEPQTVWRRAPMAVRPKAKPRHYAKAPRAAANPDSPFAGLKALLAAD